MDETHQSILKRHSRPYFEGLEIGAVSIKWVRRTANGSQRHEIVQHGGDPGKKVLEIFERHKTNNRSQIVVTGETAKILLDLPYLGSTINTRQCQIILGDPISQTFFFCKGPSHGPSIGQVRIDEHTVHVENACFYLLYRHLT